MFAIVANSIAVTEEKIKQRLAGYFLHKTDPPQPGNLENGYSGWNHGLRLPRTIVPTAPLESFKGALTLLQKLFWPLASLLVKKNYYVLTICSPAGLLTGWPVLQYLCSEWQTLLYQNSQLLVPEIAFFTYFGPTRLEKITLQLFHFQKLKAAIKVSWLAD